MKNRIIALLLMAATACSTLSAASKKTNAASASEAHKPVPTQAVQTQPEQKQLSQSDKLILKSKALIQKYNNQFYFGSGIACGAATIAVLVAAALKKGYLGQKNKVSQLEATIAQLSKPAFDLKALKKQLRNAKDKETCNELLNEFKSKDETKPYSYKNYRGSTGYAKCLIKARAMTIELDGISRPEEAETCSKNVQEKFFNEQDKQLVPSEVLKRYLRYQETTNYQFNQIFWSTEIQEKWGKLLVRAFNQEMENIKSTNRLVSESIDQDWYEVKHSDLIDAIPSGL